MTMRTRLTVGHLAILVGATAVALGVLLAPDSAGIWSIFAIYFLSLFSRWRRSTVVWCPAVLALAVATFSAGGACSPGYAGAFGSSLVAIPGFLVCLAMTPLVLFACRRDSSRRRRAGSVAVASLIAIALIVPTQWPFCGMKWTCAIEGDFQAEGAVTVPVQHEIATTFKQVDSGRNRPVPADPHKQAADGSQMFGKRARPVIRHMLGDNPRRCTRRKSAKQRRQGRRSAGRGRDQNALRI
jgi:hypothetical protein